MSSIDVDALKQEIQEKLNTQGSLSHQSFAHYFTEYKAHAHTETDAIANEILKYIANSKDIAVLDIGAGLSDIKLPEEVIASYTAYEQNEILATKAKENVRQLLWKAVVFPERFSAETKLTRKFDIIIASHCLYGLKDRQAILDHALQALELNGAMLIFHRTSSARKIEQELATNGLKFDRFSFNTLVTLPKSHEQFVMIMSMLLGIDLQGFPEVAQELFQKVSKVDPKKISIETTCIVLRHRNIQQIQHDLGENNMMLPHTKQYEGYLSQLKNKEARKVRPLAIVVPHTVSQVRECVAWAYRNEVPITVVGGGHSEHCTSSGLLISMSKFSDIEVNPSARTVTIGTGVTAGAITKKLWEYQLTVPLGARPSVGCGMILQGGTGHFSRLFGLSVDNVIGATVVLINGDAEVVQVGPDSDEKGRQILWMVKGAGSNVGLVTSITLKVYPLESVDVSQLLLSNPPSPEALITEYARIVPSLPYNSPLDLFIYQREGEIQLAVCGYTTKTSFRPASETNGNGIEKEGSKEKASKASMESALKSLKNSNGNFKETYETFTNPEDIFNCELYMSFPKGSSYKRCVFVGAASLPAITPILVDMLRKSPSKLSYYHLVHCGGSVNNEGNGVYCARNWEWAIVFTGLIEGEMTKEVRDWVYEVTHAVLPYSVAVYGVDLGPIDLRDMALAGKVFGNNLDRVCRLKTVLDPKNLMRCGLPLLEAQKLVQAERRKFLPAYPFKDRPRIVIAVSGKRFAGKDYFAVKLRELLEAEGRRVDVASISLETKRMYAEASGTDFERLVSDRNYKEGHRDRLTEFYKSRKQTTPFFDCEQLLHILARYKNTDVLVITGMREREIFQNLGMTRSTTWSVYISSSDETRCRRGWIRSQQDSDITETALDSYDCWDFKFENENDGVEDMEQFIRKQILPALAPVKYDTKEEQLASQFLYTLNFPRAGIIFRDFFPAFNDPQTKDLVVSLLGARIEKLTHPDLVIVGVESAGFKLAEVLSFHLKRTSATIRKKGKQPPPFYECPFTGSHVAVVAKEREHESHSLTLRVGELLPGTPVVLVDDVLASGDTILACKHVLHQAGVDLVKVLCVTEFKGHKGRERLAKYGIEVECLVSFPGL